MTIIKNEMKKEELKKIYNKVNAINNSLKVVENDKSLHDGSWDVFNQLAEQSSQELDDLHLLSFMIVPTQYTHQAPFIMITDYKRKVFGLLDYLHNQYLNDSTMAPDLPALMAAGLSTTVNQTQQTQVSVELNQTLISLTESLTTNADKFEPESPERKFIDKLRSAMSMAKSSIEVVFLIVKLAAEFGLTADQLAKIFIR